MKRNLSLLIKLGIGAVTVVTGVPLLWPLIPHATIFAPMAPQCAALAVPLVVMGIVMGYRKLAVLSLIVAVWNAQLIWVDVSPFGTARPAVADQPVLRVVNFNIRFSNRNLDAVADYLIASGADVVGLVEVNPRSKAALARLRTAYPYGVDCVAPASQCQNMLFSKFPLKNAYAGPIDGRYPYIVMAEVEMPGAARLTIGVTHVSTPFAKLRAPLGPVNPAQPAPRLPDAPDLEQSHQAANLAAFLQRQPADFVLIGDFNSAPWSPMQTAFRAASDLDDRGRFLPSWPTSLWPIFRIPLDQVFVRGGAHVTQIRLGPDVGSDHFPVEAEIAVAR